MFLNDAWNNASPSLPSLPAIMPSTLSDIHDLKANAIAGCSRNPVLKNEKNNQQHDGGHTQNPSQKIFPHDPCSFKSVELMVCSSFDATALATHHSLLNMSPVALFDACLRTAVTSYELNTCCTGLMSGSTYTMARRLATAGRT